MGGRAHILAAAASAGLALAAPATAACRQALALGIDVSASVDRHEYRLQSGGLAAALRDPEVRSVFLMRPEAPVALAVFEWSGSTYQRILVDWTLVTDEAVLDRIADFIDTNPVPPVQTTTGIGAAILYAGTLFQTAPDCTELTLDLSGDGQNNDWPRPEEARGHESLARVTINGLVIGADFPLDHAMNPNRMGALTRYYENRVIKGPDAFVETARDFDDFGNAMRRKLIRELMNLMIGGVPGDAGTAGGRLGDVGRGGVGPGDGWGGLQRAAAPGGLAQAGTPLPGRSAPGISQ